MTVPTETVRSGPYLGNGVSTVFDYQFRIVSEDHLLVVKADANGVETALSLDVDYTVDGVGNDVGGQVTLASPPAIGEKVSIVRDVPFTQETDLENQGAFYAETIENALDLSVMRDQQLSEQMSRAVKLGPTQIASDVDQIVQSIINLSGRILLPRAENPTERDNGDALVDGDLYYNTAQGELRCYDGVVWEAIAAVQIASQEEAEAGDDNTKMMTPLRTKQAIDVLAGSGGGSGVFGTRADAIAATIGDDVDFIVTSGYAVAGDFGGASYKRAAADPGTPGKFQSNGNAVWWELVERVVTPEMFGAVGDNATDDTAALNDADAFAAPVRLRPGRTYLAAGQLLLGQTSKKRWFVDGARGASTIRSSYNGGVCIKLGPDGATVSDIKFENIGFYQDNAATQVMFEVRAVRGTEFRNCLLSNIYYGFNLGTATRSCYIFNLYQCEVHMRLSYHQHFMTVVNCTGQIELQQTFVEGGFIAGSKGLNIPSNVASHVDHLIMMGGYFGRFNDNIYINHRVTSVQMGAGLHIEGQLEHGIWMGANGSFENWTITGCTFGISSSVNFVQVILIGYTQTTNNCDGLSITGNVFQQVRNQPAIEITAPAGNRPNGVIICGNSFPSCQDNADNNHAVIELNQINSGAVACNAGRNVNGALRYAYLVRSFNSQPGFVVDANSHGMAASGTGVTIRS